MVQAELRVRVIELVRDVDPAVLDRPAAATPGWRVRDVLAHMVGVSDDVVNGRLDGIASDEWTGAQVERRRDSIRNPRSLSRHGRCPPPRMPSGSSRRPSSLQRLRKPPTPPCEE